MVQLNRPKRGHAKYQTLGCVLVGLVITMVYTFQNDYEMTSDLYELLLNENLFNPDGDTTSLEDEAGGQEDDILSEKVTQKYQPLNCRQFLNDFDRSTDPNEGELIKVRIDNDQMTHYPFWISLHQEKFDPMRWGLKKKGFYYEKYQTPIFVSELSTNNNNHNTSNNGSHHLRVVDVGGNIGVYGLTSASFPNVIVDSFEPNPVNLFRYCQSMDLNQWTHEWDTTTNTTSNRKINLYRYGVSDAEGNFTFMDKKINPGGGALEDLQDPSHRKGHHNFYSIPVLTLDSFAQDRHWFDPITRPNIAILKMDVEGAETKVVMGAQRFIQEKLATNILMEITVSKPHHHEQVTQALTVIAKAGYQLLKVGGERGPNQDPPWKEEEAAITTSSQTTNKEDQLIQAIVQHTAKIPRKQLNLWWKYIPSSTT